MTLDYVIDTDLKVISPSKSPVPLTQPCHRYCEIQLEITPRKLVSRCFLIYLLSLPLEMNEYDLLMKYLGRTGRRNKTVLCILWLLLQADHRGSGRKMFLQSENIQETMHKILARVKVNTIPTTIKDRINPQLCRVRMKMSMERSANSKKDFTSEADLD